MTHGRIRIASKFTNAVKGTASKSPTTPTAIPREKSDRGCDGPISNREPTNLGTNKLRRLSEER